MEREKIVETLRAFAGSSINLGEAASGAYYSRNTFTYRRKAILKQTGLDVTNFHDLVELFRQFCPEDLERKEAAHGTTEKA